MGEVHSKRAAGIIYVKIDGSRVPAHGSFAYGLSGEKKEYGMNQDNTGYFTGKPEPGYIKGVITNYSDVDHEALKDAEGVTVTLELGNGKVVTAKDAVQVDAMEGNAETGEIPIEWRSDKVQEIR